MSKLKRLTLIATILLGLGSLTGCNKKGLSYSQEDIVSLDEEWDYEAFDIYEDMINSQYRSQDIELALASPSDYKDEKFTFSGVVVKTDKVIDGFQVVIVELDTREEFMLREELVSGNVVKLIYDVEGFGGDKLAKGDELALSTIFTGIEQDEIYGEVAEFEALAMLNTVDYLSALALNNYLESINTNVASMELILEEFLTVEECGEIIGKEVAKSFEEYLDSASIFSTNDGSYWLILYKPLDGGKHGLEIYRGEKDENHQVQFELESVTDFQSFDF